MGFGESGLNQSPQGYHSDEPKHYHLDVFNYSCHTVTVCMYHAKLKNCLLTYQAAQRPGANSQKAKRPQNLAFRRIPMPMPKFHTFTKANSGISDFLKIKIIL